MYKKIAKLLSLSAFSISLLATPVIAEDFPPAMNYDEFTEFFRFGTTDSTLYFGSQLLSLHHYLPGRDAQIRLDIVDSNGKIITSKERVHHYKNGKALGEIDTWVNKCASGKCLNGPGRPKLEPGLYWLVASEDGKIFSAEWFEIRAYKLGEGRFAKGQITYTYLPTTQMAQIRFDNDGDLLVKAGFAGEKAVGDKNAITKNYTATLKYNGKVFAKLPGQPKVKHKINLYPYTTLNSINLSKAKNNASLKQSDFKDGNYELSLTLDGKAYRKFSFQVKGGKIQYKGRQKESTKPQERMIVSEKSYWFWNEYAKEPARQVPEISF